jgi:hypothetical protein
MFPKGGGAFRSGASEHLRTPRRSHVLGSGAGDLRLHSSLAETEINEQ